MSSLIKNELIKIFKRKAIYIVLILAIVMAVVGNLITKFFAEAMNMMLISNYYASLKEEEYDSEEEFQKQMMQSADRNTSEGEETYRSARTNIELIGLLRKYSGQENEWKRFIIATDGYNIIYEKILNETSEDAKAYTEKYNEFVKELDELEWKEYAKKKMADVDSQIQFMNMVAGSESSDEMETLKISKQALEWRIEKNIPYSTNAMSSAISAWESGKPDAVEYEKMTDKEKERMSHEERIQREENLAQVKLVEDYMVKHADDSKIELSLVNGAYAVMPYVNSALVTVFDDLFILIIAIMFAGTIVSAEFNKGTIKNLLVRPYTRNKILLAKFITSIIMLLFGFVVIGLIQAIVGGFVFGFENYRSSVAIFDFATRSVQEMSFVKYILISILARLPKYLLLTTLAFALSTITLSSPLALTFTFVGYSAATAINTVAQSFEKAWFLKFFVTPNWDFTEFLFGKMPSFKEISLPFSAMICLIYFAIMIVASFAIFKKRDVKKV